MLGYSITERDKQKITQAIANKQVQKLKKKRKREQENLEEERVLGDETFYFIAGYTSNGVPYGITYEEMEEVEINETNSELDENDNPFVDLSKDKTN